MSKRVERGILNLGRNPIGALIALFWTFVLLLYFADPTLSPMGSNSTIVSQLDTFSDNFAWVGYIVFPLAPILIIFSLFSATPQERERITIKFRQLGAKTRARQRGKGLLDKITLQREREETEEEREEAGETVL